jgi:predicted AlkP superfamily pyrophosphatase or phosphodiesterase
MSQIMDIKPFHKNLNAKCFSFAPKKIANTNFTNFISSYTKIIPSTSYTNTFTKLKSVLLSPSRKRRFLHAYIPDFDSLSHLYGTHSEPTLNCFRLLDKKIKNFLNSIKSTNTKVIITADHGFLDIKPKNNIWVDDIAGLDDCLSLPLTGEPRVRYCYLKLSKIKDFKRIISSKLSKYCWCFNSEQLITDNFYGLGKPNKKLFDRVGDFVLIMKDGYILKQNLANEKNRHLTIGNHGGVTDDEMLVPLITFF